MSAVPAIFSSQLFFLAFHSFSGHLNHVGKALPRAILRSTPRSDWL